MRITAQNSTTIKPQLADFLANVKVGDTVKGKLIEMLGESISIKTASGQVFTAALMKSAELRLGQMVELNIHSITAEGVFTELKSDSQKPQVSEDAKLQQLFKDLDIKPSENTLQAAKLLIKYNMPVTKENITALATTQKSIESLAQGDAPKAIVMLQSQVNINHTEVTKLVKVAAAMEPQSQQIQQALQTIGSEMPAEVNQTKVSAQKQQDITQLPAASKQNEGHKPIETNVKTVMQQVTAQIDEEVMKQNAPKIEKLIDTITKTFEAVSKAKPEQTAYMMSKEVKITPSAIKTIVDHTAGRNKLADQLDGLEKLVEQLEKNQVEVKELKQELKKLFMKPEVLQEKDQVTENFKEIVKFSNKLESVIKEQGMENKLDNTVLQDVKNSFDFMKSIHANVNYLQIPLQMNENRTTAEIYVFNDKKRSRAVNPENATILISLDLKNLGHLESLISVTKKSVSITFKVENDKIKKIIGSGSKTLEQALEAKGYSLGSLKMIDLKEKFNLLELEELTSTDNSQLHVDIKV